MQYQDDILAALDAQETEKIPQVEEKNDFHASLSEIKTEHLWNTRDILDSENIFHPFVEEKNTEKQANKKWVLSTCIFLIKYFSTSATIFWVLLLASNYSAYWNITKSVIFAGELEQTKNSLIESVAAANVGEDKQERAQAQTFWKLGQEASWALLSWGEKHSIASLVAKNDDVALDIEITPYENRIVIPKIGKNIPLVDISHPNVQGVDELNDIFMKELENGVVRYPGSAKPGEVGNSFIFGHSSNFPWMEGKYNDVFALLDKVSFDDEIIVYYGQEKYIYKIQTKNVIRPGDVSVLKNNSEAWKTQISLMTCWPIGTTLNRLVLTGELQRIEK